MSDNFVIECHKLCKSFVDGKNELHVLSDIDLHIKRGAQIAIMGRSGSGKSTLLQLLGGLDNPTSGSVFINGIDILSLSEASRAKFRNKHVGFIYQMHHLLPEFTALENIAMPLLIAKMDVRKALNEAKQLIAAVGLKERSAHKPGQLSGGERQRIAIARSIATRPDCVLADEPTGNLDAENASMALKLMQDLNRERGTTFIVVTHDADLSACMDKTYHLNNGVL